jgi:hypothetical protein
LTGLHSDERLKHKNSDLGLDSTVNFGGLVLKRKLNFKRLFFGEFSFVFGQIVIQILRVFRADVLDRFIDERSELSGGNYTG